MFVSLPFKLEKLTILIIGLELDNSPRVLMPSTVQSYATTGNPHLLRQSGLPPL